MNISIVGTGYVGLVSGACFAEMGIDVTCVDIDEKKIGRLLSGEVPIYEPGLDDLVRRNVEAGRLHFTTDLSSCLDQVEVVFSAVGTPPDEDGSADLQIPFEVASNPEFLKEGAAIKDFMSPDRIVVGTESERAQRLLSRLYRPFLVNNFRIYFMDIPSAEMTKYAANAMLATRISFMNDIANLCDEVGADIDMVRKGIGTDARIGNKFLYAGCGYGGSCFPKDVRALARTGREYGSPMRIIEAVEAVNERQKEIVVRKLAAELGDLRGRTVALWGLAFKPETDDMREAPALVAIDRLTRAGAAVRVYDPAAMDECRRRVGDAVVYCSDMYEAVVDADALVLLTEWKQFRLPSWTVIRKVMANPLVIDGRNIYDKAELIAEGFTYKAIGK